MERLKSVIPADLKRMIGESTPEDLPRTCSSLLDFLSSSPQFQRVIADLTDLETAMCRKSTEAALELKRRGNERFSSGDYAEALKFYSQALRHAPMSSSDMDKNLVATLYVNRAASMQGCELSLEQWRRERWVAANVVYAGNRARIENERWLKI